MKAGSAGNAGTAGLRVADVKERKPHYFPILGVKPSSPIAILTALPS